MPYVKILNLTNNIFRLLPKSSPTMGGNKNERNGFTLLECSEILAVDWVL